MKLYRLPAAGGGIDALRLVEEDEPRPGPYEVLVRVRATSLNYRDLSVVRGTYGRGVVPANVVPVSDGAGDVAAVGEGVTRFHRGDRVAACFMPLWTAGDITPEISACSLGGAVDGMLAEYVLLHEEALVRLPETLSYEEAATLPCAAVTAWHALVVHGHVKAGDTVLLLGTGGVSIFALQFARAMGTRVILTSSSDEKIERARHMGASCGINYRHVPEWEQAVLAATEGRGVDYTVEVGGAGTLARSVEATRMGGRIGLIGVLTGAGEFNPTRIMRRTINVQGIYVGSREMFEDMLRAIEACGLRPVIDRVFDFAHAQDAYRHLLGGGHFGKVVIRHL